MPGIFISYRRDDSLGHAGRIHEKLSAVFGTPSVFMDMDDIKPGTNFVRAIEDSVQACETMLVLIGRRWLNAADAAGRRRIDDPSDFVQIEIARALDRKIRIIPVLLNNATMPSEPDLPDRLKTFSRFQALELSDERWDYDMGELLKAIGTRSSRPPGRRRWLVKAGMAFLVLLALAIGFTMRFGARPLEVGGRWTATVMYDWGGTHAEVFNFRVDEDFLNGTASFLRVDRGIEDGKVEGNRMTFTTRTEEIAGSESRTAEHKYRGIVQGDEIRFTMQTTGGFSDHPPIDFVATRH